MIEYPQVSPAIPILLAIRERKFKVVKDFIDDSSDTVTYDFTKRKLTSNDIDAITEFFNKTGLKRFFLELSSNSIQDYVTCAKGMDIMQGRIEVTCHGDGLKPIIEDIIAKQRASYTMLYQKQFKYLEDNFDFKVNSSIKIERRIL